MSKLYFSVDLEGAAGITSPNECDATLDREAYNRAVKLLCTEVSTVINTVLESGDHEIVVNDAHMTMTNLRPDLLPEKIQLLKGKPKTCAMAAGLDNSFDAAFFLGYHAKAGTPDAILNHTFHGKIFDVTVNGTSYGEFGINALYAGNCFNVPVVMTSGDLAFCNEVKALMPNITTVETKQSISATAALNKPVETLLKEYADSTKHVLNNQANWKDLILTTKAPYTLEITFIHSLCVETALMIPGFKRLSGRTIQYQCDDFKILYQALQSAYAIQGYATHVV